MAIFLDIAIVAILIVCIIIGVVKGFVKAIIGLAGVLIAVVLAVCFAPKLGQVIDEKLVRPAVVKAIISASGKDDVSEDSDAAALGSDDLALNDRILSLFGGDGSAVKDDFDENGVGASLGEYLNGLLERQSITRLASTGLASIIIFVGTGIVLAVLMLLLKPVLKLPVLKQSNALLGGVVGLAVAVVIIIAGVWAVSRFGPVFYKGGEGDNFNTSVVDKTTVFKYISERNPLNGLLENGD